MSACAGKIDGAGGGSGGSGGTPEPTGSGGASPDSVCTGMYDLSQTCQDARDSLCIDLDEETCIASGRCQALEASHVDLAANCVHEDTVYAGCDGAPTGCHGGYVHAVDPDGNHWKFWSGRIPPGWTDLGFPNFADTCE